MEKDRKVVILGVSASIAAYKAIEVANTLTKKGYDVHVTLTKNAHNLVTPNTFETLTHNKCITDDFERVETYDIKHISLAHASKFFLVCPASADIIAKLAAGIADDFLTTSFLAANCPKFVCPAMNSTMYLNPITQRNIQTLKSFGTKIIDPSSGRLACGDVGVGKLADITQIIAEVEQSISVPQILKNKTVLVTAGPTVEKIDPVRFITNHSTGKMGYAVAQAAANYGAKVVLVTGPTIIDKPTNVKVVSVESADEMYNAVVKEECVDIYIMAAAVADYKPESVADQKIKKSDETMTLKLVKNRDILKEIGLRKKEGQLICGFAMETQDLIKNATEKLRQKNCDMIVANQLNVPGAGFAGDTNKVVFITKEKVEESGVELKTEVANEILLRLMGKK
ncbi:coenzyme A biosynthesis bifunctional protein coaBC, putative [Entamoeba invadens IP1]|uniref:coenzyme A biosynthesis bifunctional protein coaBC, putative n=1 Tax=Entamoeba invadens IP1 TaxID=370355 RepID=UPI0002C3F236|nr:coenzyme A biosynthesis bifunctional protein coaBC, putative [Entamoeba invadens IP1]ELP85084.1 coenzyme A biosynthesis bifunctional protein coaBC, putative [Entamoeba invadens IP1]|eukprot:XP_004184430.1 coenzyme A biosynthesis bifunctional protein coaBC, putative [Entamoeba invadens IP1]